MSNHWAFWSSYLSTPPFVTYGQGSTSMVPNRDFSYHGLNIPEIWSGLVFNFVLNTTDAGMYEYQIHYPTVNGTLTSDVFNFTVWDRDVVRVIATGDIGTSINGTESVESMENLVHDVDFVLHAGDLSYAFTGIGSTINGQNTSDAFGRQIQPLSSTVPYMVAPGNHEMWEYECMAYAGRYFMPNQGFPNTQSNNNSVLWYSFDVNEIHFISLSSETPMSPGSPQRIWLEMDLASTSSQFTVVFLHQPAYCSNLQHGSNLQIRSDLESVSSQFGIDLIISGHVHSYERTSPVMYGVPQSKNAGTMEDPYLDSCAPLYMVVGNGGRLLHPTFSMPSPDWSVKRFAAYGWSTLDFHKNGTIVGTSFFTNGTVSDAFAISKTKKKSACPMPSFATMSSVMNLWLVLYLALIQ
eukprot:TRINITY_DN5656_c0_g2_i1.p1 TRINITY_DN5656_c0_g2~~TRINITY_DN5656_c0_g2_i1.p1  ORF type:complete len:466 (+),score=99.69 TRINITY_DN5656_c0_g2_i1:172-1398(+)